MSDFFKERDFDPGGPSAEDGKPLCTYKWAARTANRLLKERGTVVYADKSLRCQYWGPTQEPTDTHRALLINIEAIECDSVDKLLGDISKLDKAEPWLKELADRARKLQRGNK